jgi:hypothetical protein
MARYRNPIARGGDFADPFVMRHDGTYYLYATNPDVRCWRSRDLVTWEALGPTIGPDVFPGLVPFAPEVVYDNGAFFMYTSPSGQGHTVLRSDFPTGPFVPVSPNVGHAIDGHVFADEDGRRYFYWAGDEGIWGCELVAPAEFGEPVLTGIHMNGWTEGPFVDRRDGWYRMTLTGNHYLSPGYRIDAAWSTDPLRGWRPDPLNPLLVSTHGDLTGLGHSSSVVGPDLVSTWIVFHNFNPDASRDLDLDRQVSLGRSIQVLGPTRSAPAPEPPDDVLTEHPEARGAWIALVGELAPDGAHLVLQGTGGGDARARWDVATGATWTAELCLTGDGAPFLADQTFGDTLLQLPERLDPRVLHEWRIEVAAGSARVLVDRLHVATVACSPDATLGVGARSGRVDISHAAITRRSPRDADRSSPKPIPGRYWAALGVDGPRPASRLTDDMVVPERIRLEVGTSIAYEWDVARPAPVRVHLAGQFAVGDELALEVDGVAHRVSASRATTLLTLDIGLTGARPRVTLDGVRGTPVIDLITVAPMPHPGPPEVTDKRLSGTDKRVFPGLYDDTEIAARVVVEFLAADSHADLLVRATQLTDGGEGDDPVLGTDFFLGYSVQLHPDRVVLARHDFAERVLATYPAPLLPSASHDLVVRALGGTLTVELDGRVILEVDDALPHVLGHVGMRTGNARLHVESLRFESGGRSPASG